MPSQSVGGTFFVLRRSWFFGTSGGVSFSKHMPVIAHGRSQRGRVLMQLHAVVPLPAGWLCVFLTSIALTEGGLTSMKWVFSRRNDSAGSLAGHIHSSGGSFARHSASWYQYGVVATSFYIDEFALCKCLVLLGVRVVSLSTGTVPGQVTTRPRTLRGI